MADSSPLNGVEQRGEHTFELPVSRSTLTAANALAEVAWLLAQEVNKHS